MGTGVRYQLRVLSGEISGIEGHLPYLDLSALLPQKVRELSGVALVPLGRPGGEEEGHLRVGGDVAVELDEPSLLALPAPPDVEPSPVATRRLPRGVTGGVTGRPSLDPHYPLREEPDQMVQIPLGDISGVLLNSVVAW